MIEAYCIVKSPIGDDCLIRSHTVIYGGSEIGLRFVTGHHVLIRAGCAIGDDVSIGSHTTVEGNVRIGDGVRVHSGAFIPEFTVLDEGCWIGPHVVFTNSKHPNTLTSKAEREGVHVCAKAVVGAGAVILPGVTIGAGALVGAGAVVTGNVPPYATVVGNPARASSMGRRGAT